MLHSNLDRRTSEWPLSTEPFVDDHPQGILITRRLGFPLQLLRSQVERGSCDLLRQRTGAVGLRMGSQYRHAKITEQDLAPRAKQHIPRLDIAVDKMLLMGILQG